MSIDEEITEVKTDSNENNNIKIDVKNKFLNFIIKTFLKIIFIFIGMYCQTTWNVILSSLDFYIEKVKNKIKNIKILKI